MPACFVTILGVCRNVRVDNMFRLCSEALKYFIRHLVAALTITSYITDPGRAKGGAHIDVMVKRRSRAPRLQEHTCTRNGIGLMKVRGPHPGNHRAFNSD